jgi:hypothetical protein
MALSGLQKIGQQAVAGGAFGDIWKGLVQEQSVCVKIMRIFEDSNVEAVLKVCFDILHTSSSRNFFLGIWSRSHHLAPVVASERTSLFRCILSGQQVVLSLAMDGERAHHEISGGQETEQRRTSSACKSTYYSSILR